jgi:hypothetical protein
MKRYRMSFGAVSKHAGSNCIGILPHLRIQADMLFERGCSTIAKITVISFDCPGQAPNIPRQRSCLILAYARLPPARTLECLQQVERAGPASPLARPLFRQDTSYQALKAYKYRHKSTRHYCHAARIFLRARCFATLTTVWPESFKNPMGPERSVAHRRLAANATTETQSTAATLRSLRRCVLSPLAHPHQLQCIDRPNRIREVRSPGSQTFRKSQYTKFTHAAE